MSEAKHTPTPWGWYAEDSSIAILCGDDGADPHEKHVLSVSPCKACQSRTAKDEQWTWGRCRSPNAADAAFIVKAVNSHDEMLEALREAHDPLLVAANFLAKHGLMETAAFCGAAHEIVRSALAKAESS